MSEFYVNRTRGEGCMGVDVKDSRGRRFRYNAGSNGRLTVDNPEHARLIEQAAHNDGGYIQKAAGGSSRSKSPSKYCKPCRFVAYQWQDTCPKCGAPLSTEES